MTCRQWVDQGHTACESWTDQVSSTCTDWKDEGQNECSSWADEGSNQCSSWADEGSNQCSSWADEGQNQCDSWADEGYNECCDWWPCSWFCDAFVWVSNVVCNGWYWVSNWVCQAYYWVSNWVCQAYYWVSNLVCQAWYWVSNLVCQAVAWIVSAVCLLWSWIAKLVCVAWDTSRCFVIGLFGGGGRSRSPVKHVFVLMLENRAFDHMLGFSNIAGTDVTLGSANAGMSTSIDGAPGQSNMVDPSDAASQQVFTSTGADFKLVKPPDADPGHEFANALTALCGPGVSYPRGGAYPAIKNSGFIVNYANSGAQDPTKIMRCFGPEQVPVLTALAHEFVVCDRWFSSLPGPTWPNRFFMHAASSGGLDDSPNGAHVVGNTLFDGYRFQNGTIFDRLEDACIEWRIFAGDHLPVTLALSGMTLNELEGRIHDFADFADAVKDPGFSTSYIFIEPNYGNDLPTLTPNDYTCGNSQHPLDDVTRGERLIKQVYEAIRNSPHWNSSVLLVTYDEHGGFFDHVPPPPATPPGDSLSDPDNDHNGFTFAQLGVRVPAVIISPLIAQNLVDHTPYDHSSLLKTVETIFGLKPLTQRDANANDFTRLFTLASPRTNAPAALPDPAQSGFRCDDDPDMPAIGQASSGLTASGRESEWRDDSPIESTLRGFLRVALLKALTVARGRDKWNIVGEFAMARTRGAARKFIRKTAVMSQRIRTPPPGVRGRAPILPRVGTSPRRPWPADPRPPRGDLPAAPYRRG